MPIILNVSIIFTYMEKVNIEGNIHYHDIEGGFWGILSDDGNKYMPVNMPNQLKTVGARIRVRARILQDFVSSHMWGDPIEIISFETIA